MGFGEAVKAGFKNYARFEGRAVRSEFWWWVLFGVLVELALSVLFFLTGGIQVINLALTESFDPSILLIGGFAWVMLMLVRLFFIIPNLSVTVRRLRDTGRKAWYLLLLLIPLVGAIVLIIFLAEPSKK